MPTVNRIEVGAEQIRKPRFEAPPDHLLGDSMTSWIMPDRPG
jgi:hypothetical protein